MHVLSGLGSIRINNRMSRRTPTSTIPPLFKTMGFSGKPMEQLFITPLDFDILEQRGSHSFLYAPACPINH